MHKTETLSEHKINSSFKTNKETKESKNLTSAHPNLYALANQMTIVEHH